METSGAAKEKISLFSEGDQLPPLPSSRTKSQVAAARAWQAQRFGDRTTLNGFIKGRQLKKFIKMDGKSEKFLERAAARFYLSYRALEKIIRVSRTLADLDQQDEISLAQVSEALNFRLLKSYLA